MEQIYEVIMAGGQGSRFWPLSRQTMPKQLLKLDGKDTLLNETILRMEPFIDRSHAYIVTNAAQEAALKEGLPDGVPRKQVLAEPVGRNTAPCILYAAMVLAKRCGDGIMCVLPSDHHIADEETYRSVMAAAADAARAGALVTIGIAPTYPATGYGYIACGEETARSGVYKAERFVEKPALELARQYIAAGNYLWNSGVFVWKISAILHAFETLLPALYGAMREVYAAIGTEKEREALARVYPTLDSVSVDYGIMEHSDEVLVLRGDYGWNDVGSLDALPVFHTVDADGNLFLGDVLAHDSGGCIVHGGNKLIALVGAKDLMVVDTPDALLVCPKDRAQDVKYIAEMLAQQNRKER